MNEGCGNRFSICVKINPYIDAIVECGKKYSDGIHYCNKCSEKNTETKK